MKRIGMMGLSVLFIVGIVTLNHVRAADYPLVLTVVNNSGFDDTQVYLICTGSNQTGDAADHHFGYLNFSTTNGTVFENGAEVTIKRQ